MHHRECREALRREYVPGDQRKSGCERPLRGNNGQQLRRRVVGSRGNCVHRSERAHCHLPGREPWNQGNADIFYAVYRDAFQTRTKNLMQADAWHHHFANPEDESFLPKYSLLVMKGETPVGYSVCHLERSTSEKGKDDVWVTQMGVGLEWRRKGYASLLLAEILQRCQRDDIGKVVITVNIDNQAARNVYERVGFILRKRFTLFRKFVNTESPVG